MLKKIVGALLVLCTACSSGIAPSVAPPPILGPDGTPARIVDMRLQGLDDERFRLSAHRGEVVIVVYVTTWSIPAGVMLQRLKGLVTGEGAVPGLRVVAVALDERPEAMLPPFVSHTDPGFPVYPGSAADRAGQTVFGELPGWVRLKPYTVSIGPPVSVYVLKSIYRVHWAAR